MRETKMIDMELIAPNPYQPRIEFQDEALMDLAQSIRENGLIQPVTLRAMPDGTYQIVAGERRFRAMKLLGQMEIPAVVMDADELQMAEMALVENIQRENLSAIEEAKAYVDLMAYANLTQSQLALKMGKSQPSIANKLRLLNLCDEVQQAVSEKKISERHARALLGSDPAQQKKYLHAIVKKGLTVAQVEKMIHEKKAPKAKKAKLKAVSRNIRIALNTVHQAVAMIQKAGTAVALKEQENDDEVIITLTFKK